MPVNTPAVKRPIPPTSEEDDSRIVTYCLTVLMLMIPVALAVGIGYIWMKLVIAPTWGLFVAMALMFASPLIGICITHFVRKIVVYKWGVDGALGATSLPFVITTAFLIANFF